MEAIRAYLQRIKNIPLLTPKEEIGLVKKAKKGDKEARRKLINANLKLVVNIAKHYAYFDLHLMDLIAEGNIGLMRAIDKFNPPSRGEIAKRMKLAVDKVGEIEMWMNKKSSLEAPVGEDGSSQLGDFIKTTGHTDTSLEVMKIFDKERVIHLLDTLSEREKKVLDLRFGITGEKTHTLAEVSKVLKVSRERIRQIEKEALDKLKKYVLLEQEEEI